MSQQIQIKKPKEGKVGQRISGIQTTHTDTGQFLNNYELTSHVRVQTEIVQQKKIQISERVEKIVFHTFKYLLRF